MKDSNYLTIIEVAQKLGVHKETVRRWLNEGKLKGYQFGKQWRVRPDDLEKFIIKSGNTVRS